MCITLGWPYIAGVESVLGGRGPARIYSMVGAVGPVDWDRGVSPWDGLILLV